MNLKVINEEFLYTNLSSLIIASALVIWFGDGMRLLKEVCFVASVACAVLVIRGYVQNANVANDSVEFVATNLQDNSAPTFKVLKETAVVVLTVSAPTFKVLKETAVVVLTVFATSNICCVFDMCGITTPTGRRIISFAAYVEACVARVVMIILVSVACVVVVIRGYVQNVNVALPSSGAIAMTMNYLNALVNDSVKFVATNLQDISIPMFEVLNDTDVVILTVFATSAIFSVLDMCGISTPNGRRLIAFVSVCILVCFLE